MTLKTFLAAGAVAVAMSVAAGANASTVLYDNHGPNTHQVNAWTLGFGYEVSDSFTLSEASTLTGVDFDGWNPVEQTAITVDWAILDNSPQFGGTTLASGTGALTSAYLTNAPFGGYNIWAYSFDLPSVNLGAGTYWLKLANAQGASVTYWDESDGASAAWHNTNGVIGSHTFDVRGTAGGAPEPASWALMLTGFLGAGLSLRARRQMAFAKV